MLGGRGRRDLALTIGDFGRSANVNNLLSQCARFLLTRDEAAQIIDAMEGKVRARWYPIARGVGITERECATIARAFVYEGLRLQPQ
jgi:serine/threonine-protein kinase HipA